MSLRESLVRIESRWSWSFFGFLLAFIFGSITIYTSFFQDKNPNLQFEVESETPVLDLNKDIKKLDILYNGINIKQEHKNLTVLTLKVINNSDVSILKNHYDTLSPLRVSVSGADIVDEPQIIKTSNDYLKEHLDIRLDSTGCIYLPSLIIEGNEYYTLSLLLLHKNGSKPIIKPGGKVAGQPDGIDVIKLNQAQSEKTFFEKLTFGNIWIHILRYLGYVATSIIVTILIVVPSQWIQDRIQESRKKKRVLNYISKKDIDSKPETDAVFELYLDFDLDYLVETQKLLSSKNRLKVIIRGIHRRRKTRDKDYDNINEFIQFNPDTHIPESARHRLSANSNISIANKLLDLGVVIYEDNDVLINIDFQNELNDFVSYLKLI